MAAVMTAPMGPPMGGPMGPPPAAPAQMPNMAPPPNAGPPPMGGAPQAPKGELSSQVSGYGGSAKGRAGFKASLRNRKNTFMQKQQQMPPMMPPQPMGPPMGQAPMGAPPSQMSFGQTGGVPMGAMRPPQGVPMQGPPPVAGPGRMIGGNASVGSAPVQMMNGGVVPIFGGLGRY
jgi:hypothetical protein